MNNLKFFILLYLFLINMYLYSQQNETYIYNFDPKLNNIVAQFVNELKLKDYNVKGVVTDAVLRAKTFKQENQYIVFDITLNNNIVNIQMTTLAIDLDDKYDSNHNKVDAPQQFSITSPNSDPQIVQQLRSIVEYFWSLTPPLTPELEFKFVYQDKSKCVNPGEKFELNAITNFDNIPSYKTQVNHCWLFIRRIDKNTDKIVNDFNRLKTDQDKLAQVFSVFNSTQLTLINTEMKFVCKNAQVADYGYYICMADFPGKQPIFSRAFLVVVYTTNIKTIPKYLIDKNKFRIIEGELYKNYFTVEEYPFESFALQFESDPLVPGDNRKAEFKDHEKKLRIRVDISGRYYWSPTYIIQVERNPFWFNALGYSQIGLAAISLSLGFLFNDYMYDAIYQPEIDGYKSLGTISFGLASILLNSGISTLLITHFDKSTIAGGIPLEKKIWKTYFTWNGITNLSVSLLSGIASGILYLYYNNGLTSIDFSGQFEQPRLYSNQLLYNSITTGVVGAACLLVGYYLF